MEPLKPHDIVVLLKALSLGRKSWKYEILAERLNMSTSVVFRSLNRCASARFISADNYTEIYAGNILEFLQHGIQYAFPAEPGKVVRGVPTSHSAPALRRLVLSNMDTYVWPSPGGDSRGQAIEPLDKNVPNIVMGDPALYDLLVLIDAIRLSRPREKEIAAKLLSEKIKDYGSNY